MADASAVGSVDASVRMQKTPAAGAGDAGAHCAPAAPWRRGGAGSSRGARNCDQGRGAEGHRSRPDGPLQVWRTVLPAPNAASGAWRGWPPDAGPGDPPGKPAPPLERPVGTALVPGPPGNRADTPRSARGHGRVAEGQDRRLPADAVDVKSSRSFPKVYGFVRSDGLTELPEHGFFCTHTCQERLAECSVLLTSRQGGATAP
jgi:hypothetical protein